MYRSSKHSWQLALPSGLLLCACMFLLPSTSWARRALLVESTVRQPANTSYEYTYLTGTLGFTVDLVPTNVPMPTTAAGFQAYDLIVFGDPIRPFVPSDLANINANALGAAVNGNVIIIGTDPVNHYDTHGNAGKTLLENGLSFASAQIGKTGLYACLSQYYESAMSVPVPFLSAIGTPATGFTAFGTHFDNVSMCVTHPALAGLNNTTLANWSVSTHEAFSSWPSSLTPLAIAHLYGSTFACNGHAGEPYILVSGTGLVPVEGIAFKKTVTNDTGMDENGVDVVLAGTGIKVVSHDATPPFPSFSLIESGGNTILRWSGTTIPSGGTCDIQYALLSNPKVIASRWLRACPSCIITNCTKQIYISIGDSPYFLRFYNNLCHGAPLDTGPITVGYFDRFVSLPPQRLSPYLVGFDSIPGPHLIGPGDSVVVHVPDPPRKAVVRVVTYHPGTGPADPSPTSDFNEVSMSLMVWEGSGTGPAPFAPQDRDKKWRFEQFIAFARAPRPVGGGVVDFRAGPVGGEFSVTVFDLRGRRSRSLFTGALRAGESREVTWDGTDDEGHPLPIGIYWARLRGPRLDARTTLVLLR